MQPAPPAEAGLSPLDTELGLRPGQRRTPRLEEILARFGTCSDFAEAAAQFTFVTGVPLSEATARRQTYAAGAAALAQEEAELQQIERELPTPEARPQRVQLSVDATKVPLVGGEWTDVKLGAIADLLTDEDQEGQPTVEAANLSYAARWEPSHMFGRTLTLETHRRGLAVAAEVASPNDGALWIQEVVDLVAPQAVRILDEPHGAEHLAVVGALVFGADTLRARTWVDEQRDLLLYGCPSDVLTELARCQMRGPCASARTSADGQTPEAQLAREVAYFHSRAEQLEYQAFRQALYPIGSGIVESGHNVVITPRFKKAGQHWAAQHLNPLLVLRTILCSDRWSATWPRVWQHQLSTVATARRIAGEGRRTRWAATSAALAPCAPLPVPAAAPEETSPPALHTVTAAPKTPHPRPKEDHPWRTRRSTSPRSSRCAS